LRFFIFFLAAKKISHFLLYEAILLEGYSLGKAI